MLLQIRRTITNLHAYGDRAVRALEACQSNRHVFERLVQHRLGLDAGAVVLVRAYATVETACDIVGITKITIKETMVSTKLFFKGPKLFTASTNEHEIF